MPTPPSLISVEGLDACQEAAVLYAQGQIAAAVGLLEQEIGRAGADKAWSLLFALYRATFDARQFDALAARFVETFGAAAPTWLDAGLMRKLPEAMRESGDAYVELMGELADPSPPRFEALHARCARHAVVHLDATRLGGVDADSAQRLSKLLRVLAGDGTGIFMSGGERLIASLRDKLLATPQQIAYWTLLLDLYQVQDREADFERAAVEFALSTGSEQPQWQWAVLPVLHISSVEEKRSTPRYSGSEIVSLHGTIDDANDAQLLDVRHAGSERQYLNLELSRVVRMSPAAARFLVSLANERVEQGKVMRLIRANPLLEALLETVALDPRVQRVRAQFA
ncbi:MAG TPA: hypothetical protein VFB54_00870 [Burkholderiales bacterium]|nr:hypothetical protein [Burkholderiales bacterium]